jgi:hypothetical protein
MKKTYFVLLILFSLTLFLPSFAQTQTKNIKNIDTPTAFTLGRGVYSISVMGYDGGGLEFSTAAGLFDAFYFGISLDFQNVIGKETPRLHVPGVVAKIQLTDTVAGWPIYMAIGYDSFYMGGYGIRNDSRNIVDRIIFGPYFVITQPIYLLTGEQYVSYGIRLPTQPIYVPDETSYFLALTFPFTEKFHFKCEMARVFWNFRRPDHWLYNFGFSYIFEGKLAFSFDFLWQPGETPSRVLRVEYRDRF